MSAQPLTPLTPEEYIALELASETRHEYYNGHMFAMAGASFAHMTIVGNVTGLLWQALRGRDGIVLPIDARVRISRNYAYPDIMVVCGKPKMSNDQRDTLENPTLIVEVFSKSTEAHDRGFKFAEYRKLESLQEYVLVSQSEARIEKFHRQPQGWVLSESLGLDQTVDFESVTSRIPTAEIYANVVFSPEENLQPNAEPQHL